MSVDLGYASVLGTDAVGQPGQRRFRLFVMSERGSAVMWMEKEHLNSLSLALDRFLAMISEGQILRTEAQAGIRPSPKSMPANFPQRPTYEFQVGQMKLNYDEQETAFLLIVTPLEITMERGQEPQIYMREDDDVSFHFTLPDAHELSSGIAQIVSAGRPVCPLCHAPLDGGPHACVKQNGHREILRIEEQDEDEEE
ncbi:hypothetical protein KSF_024700 [Reticulibacter mediterranei]|uniref:DUF3090 domain-containing protein n=1 Tax=Reticulibacter mediterranei TaxID=2778369 RepID=A0A8J3N000_9CHLR|nr:DUF3090 family protein [Reticulibacter mediterranei]GHO92422.1 hypothetical protein KSF_024700 [Reticulibacter mediterranei]